MKHRVAREFFRNFFLGFGGLIAVIAVMGLIFELALRPAAASGVLEGAFE